MEAQTRGTFVELFSECLDIAIWKGSGVVLIADNDVKAGETEDICAKVYDKKKRKCHGHRRVLISQYMKHNRVDLANQRHKTSGLDHRTRRKNVRV